MSFVPSPTASNARHRFRTSRRHFLEVRQYFLAEQTRLFEAVVSPQFQHNMRTARRAIFLESLYALRRGACDGANFLQNGIGNGARRGLAPTSLHSLRDGPNFVEAEACAFEQRVGRAANVLHFIG